MTRRDLDVMKASGLIALAVLAGVLVNVLAITRARAEASEVCSIYTTCAGAEASAYAWRAPRVHLRQRAAPDPSLLALIDASASAVGVSIAIARAIVRQESGFKPWIRGRAGEWGLTQIKCATARGLGFAGNCAQLADASINLRWGLLHLRRAIDRGGAGCAGVALHQMGLGARPRCTSYGRQVMRGI